MARVQEFEKWEASQQCLGNFIVTKAKPHVYWLPKKLDEKATEKLNSSRKFHESEYCVMCVYSGNSFLTKFLQITAS